MSHPDDCGLQRPLPLAITKTLGWTLILESLNNVGLEETDLHFPPVVIYGAGVIAQD